MKNLTSLALILSASTLLVFAAGKLTQPLNASIQTKTPFEKCVTDSINASLSDPESYELDQYEAESYCAEKLK